MSSNGICIFFVLSYKLRFKGILGVKWFPTVELNCKVQMTSDLFYHNAIYAEFIISIAYLLIQHSFSMVFTKKERNKKNINMKTNKQHNTHFVYEIKVLINIHSYLTIYLKGKMTKAASTSEYK